MSTELKNKDYKCVNYQKWTYICWMSMDPTNGHSHCLELCFEHFNLISHKTVILMAFLLRNDQGVDHQVAVRVIVAVSELMSCQYRTCLYLLHSIRFRLFNKGFDDFYWTVNGPQISRHAQVP